MSQDFLQFFRERSALALTLGGELSGYQLAFETWGKLDANHSNAILLFPGLSASSHAASHGREDVPGWWEGMIGRGEALDTDRYFIICANHLGGCFGSTGPASNNPLTGKPFGSQFPPLMIQDLAYTARQLIAHLGIKQLYCTIGTSMGAMLAAEFAAAFPEAVRRLIMISGSGRPGPQSIAFRFVQRQVILGDPGFHQGDYYDKGGSPRLSMGIARMIGNITYRSRDEFNRRFGRTRTNHGYSFGPDFQVESYLHHMGNKLANAFDANSFMVLTKAIDLYSLGYGFPSHTDGVKRIQAKTLCVGVSTDLLFPWEEQENVHRMLKQMGRDSRFELLESTAGHDAFLVEVDYFRGLLGSFLNR